MAKEPTHDQRVAEHQKAGMNRTQASAAAIRDRRIELDRQADVTFRRDPSK